MELINYFFQSPIYIGLPVFFISVFIITILIASPFLIMIYLFSDKSEMSTHTSVDSSSGGAEVCAIVCVTCI